MWRGPRGAPERRPRPERYPAFRVARDPALGAGGILGDESRVLHRGPSPRIASRSFRGTDLALRNEARPPERISHTVATCRSTPWSARAIDGRRRYGAPKKTARQVPLRARPLRYPETSSSTAPTCTRATEVQTARNGSVGHDLIFAIASSAEVSATSSLRATRPGDETAGQRPGERKQPRCRRCSPPRIGSAAPRYSRDAEVDSRFSVCRDMCTPDFSSPPVPPHRGLNVVCLWSVRDGTPGAGSPPAG